jgi:hypothetical protein
MAEINWNNIYKSYLDQYKDPFKAVEYTVFGRLTGSKKIPTTYTQDQWYEYEAPDYWKAIKSPVNPDDPLRETTIKIKNAKSPSDVFAIANSAPSSAIGVGKLFREYADYRDYLMGLYTQKVQAEKKASSTSSNWWKQYGLPDPSKRFDSLKTYAEAVKSGSKPAKPTNIYSPAFDYLTTETTKYKAQLEKKGIKGADLAARVADFSVGLAGALDKKMTSAGFTPFLIAAQQRIKARG